jgi:hypothetical protein
MAKKRRALLIILLLLGVLVFICRNRLLNAIQQELISSISSKAVVDNRHLLRDSSFSHHLLYSLSGTQRLWPHRVNSRRRFRYLYSEFAGFECDIQFLKSDSTLALGHDGPGPDRFTDYLEQDSTKKKLVWLDVKNLDTNNVRAFCTRLHALDQAYAVSHRIIIECYDTTTALMVNAQGFLTCLNFSWITNEARIDAIRALCPEKINLLSGEAAVQPLISRDFPGLGRLSYDIRFRDGMDRDILLRQANDTGLLVSLINVKSPGYR